MSRSQRRTPTHLKSSWLQIFRVRNTSEAAAIDGLIPNTPTARREIWGPWRAPCDYLGLSPAFSFREICVSDGLQTCCIKSVQPYRLSFFIWSLTSPKVF